MKRKTNARLYVLEGRDGVGKSTIASALAQRLASGGRQVSTLSFPGKEAGTLGAHVYNLYHNPRLFGVFDICPVAVQALMTAAHADVIIRSVLPTLEMGTDVILDRYWWSTWVYATAQGVDPSIINSLIEFEVKTWRGVAPESIFLIERKQPSQSEHSHSQSTALSKLYNELFNSKWERSQALRVPNDKTVADAIEFIIQRTPSLKLVPNPRTSSVGTQVKLVRSEAVSRSLSERTVMGQLKRRR